LGIIFMGMMALGVFLLIIGAGIAARMIYLKLVNKRIATHSCRTGHDAKRNVSRNKNTNRNRAYTTVIDADNPDKEYQIPTFK